MAMRVPSRCPPYGPARATSVTKGGGKKGKEERDRGWWGWGWCWGGRGVVAQQQRPRRRHSCCGARHNRGRQQTHQSQRLSRSFSSFSRSLSLSLVSRLSPHSRDVRTFVSHHRSVRVFSSAARSPPTRLTLRRIGRGREESSLFRTLARSHWLCCTDQLVNG